MDKASLMPSLKLNQLSLTDGETDEVIAFFQALKKGEDNISALDTANVEPMIHVVGLTNMLREDVSSQPFTRDQLQEGAPEAMDGYWQVPRLLD